MTFINPSLDGPLFISKSIASVPMLRSLILIKDTHIPAQAHHQLGFM